MNKSVLIAYLFILVLQVLSMTDSSTNWKHEQENKQLSKKQLEKRGRNSFEKIVDGDVNVDSHRTRR